MFSLKAFHNRTSVQEKKRLFVAIFSEQSESRGGETPRGYLHMPCAYALLAPQLGSITSFKNQGSPEFYIYNIDQSAKRADKV